MQIRINKYDTAKIGRYNGKFQVMIGREKEDGEFMPHFYQVTNKGGSKVNVPVALTFEDDATAVGFINAVAAELK
jgi:hypothetical protein